MALGGVPANRTEVVFILLDYLCGTCDSLTESLQERAAIYDYIPCGGCGAMAGRTISPVRGKMGLASVSTGKNERPAGTLNTEPLADGMRYSQWRKKYSVKRG